MSTNINTTYAKDYVFKDEEFNLLKMYRDTIIKAFEIHKDKNTEFISVQLGISSKSLYRYCNQFNIRHLIVENKKYRKSFLKTQ